MGQSGGSGEAASTSPLNPDRFNQQQLWEVVGKGGKFAGEVAFWYIRGLPFIGTAFTVYGLARMAQHKGKEIQAKGGLKAWVDGQLQEWQDVKTAAGITSVAAGALIGVANVITAEAVANAMPEAATSRFARRLWLTGSQSFMSYAAARLGQGLTMGIAEKVGPQRRREFTQNAGKWIDRTIQVAAATTSVVLLAEAGFHFQTLDVAQTGLHQTGDIVEGLGKNLGTGVHDWWEKTVADAQALVTRLKATPPITPAPTLTSTPEPTSTPEATATLPPPTAYQTETPSPEPSPTLEPWQVDIKPSIDQLNAAIARGDVREVAGHPSLFAANLDTDPQPEAYYQLENGGLAHLYYETADGTFAEDTT
jgi:hypothetical protein